MLGDGHARYRYLTAHAVVVLGVADELVEEPWSGLCRGEAADHDENFDRVAEGAGGLFEVRAEYGDGMRTRQRPCRTRVSAPGAGHRRS